MLKKVTFLLPLAYNDGSPVPKATLQRIFQEIFLRFHGWTVAGEVKGAYRMRQTGRKRVEKLLQVWVVVEEEDLPDLRKAVSEFGALLEQEVMYFEVADSDVEFLPPARAEEDGDE